MKFKGSVVTKDQTGVLNYLASFLIKIKHRLPEGLEIPTPSLMNGDESIKFLKETLGEIDPLFVFGQTKVDKGDTTYTHRNSGGECWVIKVTDLSSANDDEAVVEFLYDGSRETFVHLIDQLNLMKAFEDTAEWVEYSDPICNTLHLYPHETILQGFVKADIVVRRRLIQSYIHQLVAEGEQGDFIKYGSYKTSEGEQGLGWFVIDSKFCKDHRNELIKNYFNSKENGIRIEALKEYVALNKSVKRVLAHI